jgi:hypothetical protein
MPTPHSSPNKRRKLLKFLGLTGLFGSIKSQAQIRVREVVAPQINNNVLTTLAGGDYITVKLLRPEDLLSLELRFYNCNLNGNKITVKNSPAHLVVVFQPQSMSEQAWPETESGLSTPTVPSRLIIGGQSRLVFQIPSSISSIALTAAELLAWEKFDLVVNERAKGIGNAKRFTQPSVQNKQLNDLQNKVKPGDINKSVPPKRGMTKDEKIYIAEMQVNSPGLLQNINRAVSNAAALSKDAVAPPAPLETSLEIPVKLYLSPTKDAGWKHPVQLKSVQGFIKSTNKLFELWHTRMGKKIGGKVVENGLTNEDRLLRALWGDDINKDYTQDVIEKEDVQLGLTSMNNKDRHQIVHESSNFTIAGFYPQPVKAYQLFLTTLGAWLDSELTVDKNSLIKGGIFQGTSAAGKNGFNLLKWRHIETMGREHYVEIIRAGYILPFGHSAVLMKITERKLHPNTGTAANFQREIIVITEPIKDYNFQDSEGDYMNFTFSSIEVLTTTSPIIDTPQPFLSPNGPAAKDQFVIKAGGKEVVFKFRGKDLNDNNIDFTMPLIFINAEITGSKAVMQSLIDRYNLSSMPAPRSANFKGQKLTLAPPVINAATTEFAAHAITFGTFAYNKFGEIQGFLPTIKNVEIIEPSTQRITGNASPVAVALYSPDKSQKNEGGVFARFLKSEPINFAGNADKVGGLATPNFNLAGLSKTAGAFAGNVENFANKVSSATDYFNVNNLPDPTLFGVFKLSQILKFVQGDTFDLSKSIAQRVNNSGIPNLVTEDTNDAFITTYAIKPNVSKVSIGSNFASFIPASEANSFSSVSSIKAFKNTSKVPEFSSNSALKNFTVGIVGVGSEYLINVKFDHIKFEVTDKKKPDVSVKMADKDGIFFGGPLKFINLLNSIIPMNGFDDPPYLDVSLTGVKCGYTQAVPNLQLGAFTLANISIGAEVNLPFTGGPLTLGFRFCERHQPFTLTFAFLGGGGFFGMEVDLQGIRQIEAAFELGAAASVNFGVASGAVSIMAGIYFKMTFESGQNSTQLTGYVRINGAVCVLGLITASIELYMALTYLIDKNKAYGEASLKIKVEVLFFSKTVTIQTQRTFAGSGNDPNFGATMQPIDWATYCEAFAA